MKKIFTLILALIGLHVFAQDSLKIYNDSRSHITTSGMEILGGWGILNLGTGAIGWSGSHDPEARYFYQMTTIWGSVNFGTALIGYAQTQRNRRKKLSPAEMIAEQKKIEKIFLINGGLDIGYIGTGLYLKLAGDSRHSPIMKGYGSSILMQGGFLLLFDGLMYHAEKSNGSKMRNFLEKHPITFDGKRVGMIFNM
jgi:hypothetical protein